MPQLSAQAAGHFEQAHPNSMLNCELPMQVGTNVSRHDWHCGFCKHATSCGAHCPAAQLPQA